MTYWADQKGELTHADGSKKNTSSFMQKLNEIKDNYQVPYYRVFPKHKALANLLDDIKQKKIGTLYKKIVLLESRPFLRKIKKHIRSINRNDKPK
ncbi:hypothetical protein [Gaetbulibacter jejuensis]|uniref:hypothetical protein n=1 Tax=Gaetbulibacter jejuensis TaxID=584607 RepID=UPI0030093737